MTIDAEIGFGILIKVEATPGSGTFTTLGKQKDVKGGGWSVDAVDASHNESPNKVKEKIPGMIDLKSTSYEMQYVLGGSAEASVTALRGLVRNWRIVHPSGDYIAFAGFISDFDPDMSTEDKSAAKVEIMPTGDQSLVAATAPANVIKPAISGVLTVGEVLTAYEGTWDNEPTSFTYQWKNAGTDISGATARTYTLVSGDSGDAITVAVTGINGAGNATATSAAVVCG